jgi:hypothetical protein
MMHKDIQSAASAESMPTLLLMAQINEYVNEKEWHHPAGNLLEYMVGSLWIVIALRKMQ